MKNEEVVARGGGSEQARFCSIGGNCRVCNSHREEQEDTGEALSWWDRLSEEEHNVLIALLYKLDLFDFVEIDQKGNYVRIKT